MLAVSIDSFLKKIIHYKRIFVDFRSDVHVGLYNYLKHKSIFNQLLFQQQLRMKKTTFIQNIHYLIHDLINTE